MRRGEMYIYYDLATEAAYLKVYISADVGTAQIVTI